MTSRDHIVGYLDAAETPNILIRYVPNGSVESAVTVAVPIDR
ncbi:hypothetical protein [Paracoccus amoyensis]